MRLTHPTNLRESSVGGKPLNSNISSKYYFQIYIVAAVVPISDLCSLEKLNLNWILQNNWIIVEFLPNLGST